LALRVEVVGMAVVGALGAYAFAACFSRSHAARALVVVLWAVNGRWALQTAAGHTWQLAYAVMPGCFFFYERAPERGLLPARGASAGAAISLAMLVYAGGIYPLPHTALTLALYATVLAASERSTRPLRALAICAALGVGLAAPKLFPIIEG